MTGLDNWIKKPLKQRQLLTGLSLSLWILLNPSYAVAQPIPKAVSVLQQCPSTLTALMDRMLLDLPSYINRVRIRAGITKSSIVLAAKPEFEPLPLSATATLPAEIPASDIEQVFFTTLMRRYDSGRTVHIQEYHWLFLTHPPTKDWQFVMMYSILGTYPAANNVPLPPRSSNDGSTAVAIRDWLRDCNLGLLTAPQGSRI